MFSRFLKDVDFLHGPNWIGFFPLYPWRPEDPLAFPCYIAVWRHCTEIGSQHLADGRLQVLAVGSRYSKIDSYGCQATDVLFVKKYLMSCPDRSLGWLIWLLLAGKLKKESRLERIYNMLPSLPARLIFWGITSTYRYEAFTSILACFRMLPGEGF